MISSSLLALSIFPITFLRISSTILLKSSLSFSFNVEFIISCFLFSAAWVSSALAAVFLLSKLFVGWPFKSAVAVSKAVLASSTSAWVAGFFSAIRFAFANAVSYAVFLSWSAFTYLSLAFKVVSFAISAFKASLFVGWPSKAVRADSNAVFAALTSSWEAAPSANTSFAFVKAWSYASFLPWSAFLYWTVAFVSVSRLISVFNSALSASSGTALSLIQRCSLGIVKTLTVVPALFTNSTFALPPLMKEKTSFCTLGSFVKRSIVPTYFLASSLYKSWCPFPGTGTIRFIVPSNSSPSI